MTARTVTTSSKNTFKLGVVSSYVPKKCGIATFTNNLLLGLKDVGLMPELLVVAAESREKHIYGPEVKAVINTAKHLSYLKAANLLKGKEPNITLVQHEYGLYGGPWTNFTVNGVRHHDPTGSYLLELIEALPGPVITTLHTVLKDLDPLRQGVQGQIINRSDRVIVMSEGSKSIILKQFPDAKAKLVIIPHGVMVRRKQEEKSSTLKRLGLEDDRFYLSVSGLISPNKKIETIIEALPAIIAKHPQAQLLVIGQTHPQILKDVGDVYRVGLKKLAHKLGVANHVKFVNKYMSSDELLDYLAITDVYLTIHNDPQQAVSGTLANAVGNGLIVVSTPYPYAKELLANNRGVLVPFNDSTAIARATNRLIENQGLYREIRHNAHAYGRKMAWDKVAQAYWDLMKVVEDEHR